MASRRFDGEKATQEEASKEEDALRTQRLLYGTEKDKVMPITTFRVNNDSFYTSDKDLIDLLPKGFYVERIVKKRFFHKSVESYQLLYNYTGNGLDFQIINFWGKESSINVWVSKEVIMAYLIARSNYIDYIRKER